MDTQSLKQLAQNPAHIPGIYNYCDRWCERCAFTSRCLNFAIGEEWSSGTHTTEVNSSEFWDQLQEMFELTRKMIEEHAEREGIDLNSLDFTDIQEELAIEDARAEQHAFCIRARSYSDEVNNWFEKSEAILNEKTDELVMIKVTEASDQLPECTAASIGDSIDIICWYKFQIYVKIVRALRSKLDEDDEEYFDFPKDSDGSAKVALIGIDRSIVAWETLRVELEEPASEILDMQISLDKLRRGVEQTFPEARNFIRPGFDE